MTHNNTHIFISTGSNNIYVVDEQLNILQTLAIRNERGYPLKNINELEWVLDKGEAYIYANIWQTKDIVKINID
jgi:glutamine cyclotransferase